MSAPVMRRLLHAIAALVTLASTAISASAIEGAADMSISEWENLWTRVLSEHVDKEGRIDFFALKKDHADLDRVVAFIAGLDPASRPDRFPSRESRLAYYINAYNALAMYGVVQADIPESLGGLTKFTFFFFRTFTIGGKSISLYKFENDVIRPIGEERIHFALNCMVVSCPRLPRQAFRAEMLERQLDTAARTFINEPRHLRNDAAKGEVWLSEIFDFYTRDFLARAPNLIAYVNRYRTEKISPEFRIRFIDYDWTVNDRGRVGGKIPRRS